jgi:hypothetical protein
VRLRLAPRHGVARILLFFVRSREARRRRLGRQGLSDFGPMNCQRDLILIKDRFLAVAF